jgi:Tol biopolymer transport system component
MTGRARLAPPAGALALAAACALAAGGATRAGAALPVPATAAASDSLIRAGENHFEHLWQITFGGQNAEGYWSADGTKLIFQSTRDGYPCDQMYVMDLKSGKTRRVSAGRGRTTCGYFYDHDHRILFSSTHLTSDSCPPPPDYSHGYVWPVLPGYEIFTARPDGSDLKRLTNHPGYDAEATLSTDGKWIVYTSLEDGDLDLFKMHPDGSERTRLTNELGYDGGAFFSRDGEWICYRRGPLADSSEVATYRSLIAQNLVRPTRMDLWVMHSNGAGKRQITNQPGASFAPYFTPDGHSIIYSSNWENPTTRNFDLYLVSVDGQAPQQAVTRDPSFDGFPMFSPDGQWLVFASNRGGKVRGETNLFLAKWRP